jgi:hypothetical protein
MFVEWLFMFLAIYLFDNKSLKLLDGWACFGLNRGGLVPFAEFTRLPKNEFDVSWVFLLSRSLVELFVCNLFKLGSFAFFVDYVIEANWGLVLLDDLKFLIFFMELSRSPLDLFNESGARLDCLLPGVS